MTLSFQLFLLGTFYMFTGLSREDTLVRCLLTAKEHLSFPNENPDVDKLPLRNIV